MDLRIGSTDFPVDLLQTFGVSSISINVPGLPRPISVRLNGTDAYIFRKVFIGQQYDYSLPADPKVIIDAGAHVGHATAWFSARFPRATIIAIEPDPTISAFCSRIAASFRTFTWSIQRLILVQLTISFIRLTLIKLIFSS